MIIASFSFTLFAFGEEAELIKEMGISTIVICCLCLASLSAANTVSKEIEKGTIVTLLSKPVSKKAIILGKFFGILAVVLFTFIMMGIFLTTLLCVKESSEYHINLASSFKHLAYPTVFQLAFSFFQLAIMCAVAIAGSLYLPLASNLSFCMFIYALGNLINFFQELFRKNDGGFPWYVSLFYVFFPNLEGFSAIGMGSCPENVSLGYMVLLAIYAVLYITLAITATFEFFDRKEC